MKIHKSTLMKLGGALTALIGSFGLVFGLAAFDHTSLFVNFDHPNDIESYFDATPQKTTWNVTSGSDPLKPLTFGEPAVPFEQQNNSQDKFNYSALVIDGATHQVLDKSFNQSGYQGLVDWIWTNDWYNHQKEVDVADPTSTWNNKVGSGNGTKPPNDNANDFWQTYESLINGGTKTLVLPGYMHQSGLTNFKTKSQEKYDKAGYILLDANTPEDKNIASVIFRSDEAAFMSGIATCQYLNDNFDEYKDGGLRVGTFGGIAIPSVTIYMGGFEYGVKVWNDNIQAIAQANNWTNPEEHEVNVINLGSKDSWFSNSFSIGDGKPLVKALLQRGADAILPVAGPQTIDTVKQINSSKANCIVVGVDTAQENDPSTNEQGEYKDKTGNDDIIKFSATKNIAGITSKILSLAMAHHPDDAIEGGDVTVGSFGYLTVGNTTNEGIMPSENSFPYLLEFINSAFGVPIPPDLTPDQQYAFILEQLGGKSSRINYFDGDHISSKDFMQLRI